MTDKVLEAEVFKIRKRELAQLQVDEMETLMKTVSSREYAKANVKLGRSNRIWKTKYNDELFEMAVYYVKVGWVENGDSFPMLAGLAYYLGVCNSTVAKWRDDEDKPEFKQLIDIMMSNQERILLNKGGNGSITPQIAKLVLSRHGYAERKEITGANGGPIESRTWSTKIVDPARPDADHLEEDTG